MSGMDINQILEYLPHRYPFLLVDRVLSCEPGKTITALKNVSINEPFFQGHFPNYPVMPGVLIIECMAQAAAILTFHSEKARPDKRSVYFFVGIDNARFKKPVVPGDALRLEVAITRHVRGIWKFAAQAWVGESMAAESEIMCTVRSIREEGV
ncbi:MAG TPA: 3-hydroxyacyl-ACP dehydratase FabZ [Burkholderiales bacterium]|nr:3-hydroxyacyl-ACP dehydratase FabZ [Burkholderiales bacterium]